MCREAEPEECYLKDMLQQLNSIISAKPSEKAVIRQGESSRLQELPKLSAVLVSPSYRKPLVFDFRGSRGSCVYSHLLDQ